MKDIKLLREKQLTSSKNDAAIFSLEKTREVASKPVIPELIETLISRGSKRLTIEINQRQLNISSSAIQSAILSYQKLIARLTNRLIIQRFSGFRSTRNPFWQSKKVFPGGGERLERALLDAYIAWEVDGNTFNEQGSYSELYRLLEITQINWINSTLELLSRVKQHSAELTQFINVSSNQILEHLTSIEFGISDLHRSGRAVAILNFGKDKVVYKPRTLDGELIWQKILEDVLVKGLDLSNFSPKVLNFDEYGFMQHVTHTPCSSLEEVQRCYQRYGAILAISHGLGTIDLHHENIIVSGEYPTVIDAETIFHARLSYLENYDELYDFNYDFDCNDFNSVVLYKSVLMSGLLPMSINLANVDKGNLVVNECNIGGLSAYGRETIQDLVPCGQGSDDLQMQQVLMESEVFPNLPYLVDELQLSSDFVNDIIQGFQTAYKYIQNSGIYSSDIDKILNSCQDKRTRIIVRSTMQYFTIFSRSISPQFLDSTETRKLAIKSDLEKLFPNQSQVNQKIGFYEVQDLINGDIPRFEIPNKQECLNESISLLESPLDNARNHLKQLNSVDLELQVISIRESLKNQNNKLSETTLDPSNTFSLGQHAIEIISNIVESISSNKTEPFWAYLAFPDKTGAAFIHSDRGALYEGCAGTAIAVAEAGYIEKNMEWSNLAVRIFENLVDEGVEIYVKRGSSISRGLGGLIYAMLRVAEASGQTSLLESAVNLAIKYGHQLIKIDEPYDVLNGKAGFLMVLMALYRRDAKSSLQELIHLFAEKIIEDSITTKEGTFWPSYKQKNISNVAHGCSGIAMALARYANRFDSRTAAKLSINAIRFDDSFWIAEEQGWLDTRIRVSDSNKKVHLGKHTHWSWCNGRAGAILARLAVAQALDCPLENDFVFKALNAEYNNVMSRFFPGLCCGTSGVIDSLLKVNELMPDNHVSTCLNQAVKTLTNHRNRNHYSTLSTSLFGGSSGFAFAMMRIAWPSKIRSVLWFD